MGQIINSYQLCQPGAGGVLKPLIYCNPDEDTRKNAISIEGIMLDALFKVRPKFRNQRLARCFEAVLANLPAGSVLTHLDILFNPAYKVDVLNMMIDACKRRNFSVIWPGKYKDGKLIYAEDGYSGSKVYVIEYYEVTCVL